MTDSSSLSPAASADAAPTFDRLGLAPALARAVSEMGFVGMTPIQAQAIPVVLTGRDVMGAAQTGTGKTAAFALPLLQRLLKHENPSMSPARHPVRALVLLPTRELADQVAAQVKLFARHTLLRSAVVFGGVDMAPQTAELRRGVEVLVATPGRLLDHIEAKTAQLGQVEYVVLDEADRMLDIGFLPDLQRILSHLPRQRTTLLFSATFSPEIKRLAGSYLQDPTTIEVARPNATASTVAQHFFAVEEDDKRHALHQLVRSRAIRQAFVFTNSKLGCARLARALERDGLKASAMHGDKSQDERLKTLDAFKRGEVDLLICTDVAARGLDIKDVPAVFNYDLPFNAEDYVHRIGRTGRAGADGLALNFVAKKDARLLAEIEKLVRIKAELEAVEFDENLPDIHRQGRINDGRRRFHESEQARDEGRHPRAQRSDFARVTPQRASDPFFDQPYQPSVPTSAAAPAWEAAPKRPALRLSANIRPKRSTAALFKAVPPPAADGAAPATGVV